MNRVFLDSSCAVAVLLGEPAAERVLRRLRDAVVYACPLLEAEVLATARRESIAIDPRAVFWDLVWTLPDRALSGEVARVLEAGYLRGADTWHIAHALWLSPGGTDLLFLTLDENQRRAAAGVGLSAPKIA